MNNVMTHIELTQATPITKAPPSQHSLHSLAAGLLSVFGKAETNDKTRFLIQAALEGYTYAEFSEAMRKAQSMAAEADRLSGWKKDGKKGRSAYGPKESSFAQRASEKRQVFGVAKQNMGHLVPTFSTRADGKVIYNPDIIPSWDQALILSRAWLKDKGLAWDGQKVDDLRKQKEHKVELEADKKAVDAAMQEYPREQNEPMRDYLLRIEKTVEENKTLMALESLEQALDTAAAKIVQEWGLANAMSIAEKILTACQEQAQGIT
jgi:hypothetical protein